MQLEYFPCSNFAGGFHILLGNVKLVPLHVGDNLAIEGRLGATRIWAPSRGLRYFESSWNKLGNTFCFEVASS